LRQRSAELLERFGLSARADETVENLSGGLQRRVEIAKALLHRPSVLLLDEPSTGLDPGARRDLWHHLRNLQAERRVTILLTTHLMDEADQCDRLLVLDQGKKITVDTPAALKAQVSGTVIVARTTDPQALREQVRIKLNLPAQLIEGALRLEWQPDAGHGTAAEWAGKLLQEFPKEIDSVTLSQPTLEDVFIHLTGKGFSASQPES
jgi:ABC-2 type transport system ATP-binding protein